MVENPNLLHNVHATEGAVCFDYHGWHARLQAPNDHALRLTVTAGAWPTHPSIPADPELTKHADETVASGGSGQRYETPIVIATGQVPLTLTDRTISLGQYQLHLTDGQLRVSRAGQWLLTQSLPQLTATAWTSWVRSAPSAHYFGGGTQNGQVEQTGRLLQIKNENRWTRGGVSSPVPFYWSTSGYGVLVNSFTPGEYDFGDPLRGAYLTHADSVYDAYLLLGATPGALLRAYYELTGAPVRLPAFAFYPAHFNAYNRNYWVGVTADSAGARQFADGQWYKAYQPLNKATFNLNYRPGTITVQGQTLVPNVYGNGHVTFRDPDAAGMPQTAIHETLNGEHDRQFSARAVLDQYRAQGFPLGWFIPNDGYGAGYGQTASFAGDLANLKSFIEYSNQTGVQVGLWTQAQLTPQDPAHPQKNERDLVKEIAAGSRAVKTDVAWVGEGYTFGVNATAQIQAAFQARQLRPLTVTVDGWAGTQRAAMVWTGDQAGSDWRNLETHVASYLAAGLSGQPHIASDVDGIYGGGDPVIQTRDLQWKAFTPSFFAMDGWGVQPKLLGLETGAPYAAIDRAWLQYHTMLVPYLYSLAAAAAHTGAPIMRPTFWADSTALTAGELGDQFLVGDALLVAPIVRPYRLQKDGTATRSSLYLPQGTWYDGWTGQAFTGGRTLSDVTAPLSQLPLYVKAGSILPLAKPHLNPSTRAAARLVDYWPGPAASVTLVEDDGQTLAYQSGAQATTTISTTVANGQITLTVAPTQGHFAGQAETVPVQLFIAGPAPKHISALSGQTAVAFTTAAGLRPADPLAALGRKETGLTLTFAARSIREPLTVTMGW